MGRADTRRKLLTEAQVCRILKGAKRAGVEVVVDCLPDGTVRISPAGEVKVDPYDEWKKSTEGAA